MILRRRFLEFVSNSAPSNGQIKRWLHSRKYVTKMFQNFGKLQPESTDLSSSSQKLMLYNEVIQSCHSGTYHLLPLGLRALEKLIRIIDQEMQAIGGQKIAMPTLAPSAAWQKSGRWEDAGAELFKLKDRHNIEYCLGPTHEELVTELFTSISPVSYKRLPILLYQMTRKFRDEMSPKYGLLRGREFEMKDMYTFDVNEEAALKTYSSVCKAYNTIFDRLGVNYVKAVGATGNIGGSFSHEYQLPAEIGEDTILVCNRCGFASNIELIEDYDSCNIKSHCPNKEACCDIKETQAIEVGHTFLLGTKYSSVFGAKFQTEMGKPELTQMGCYGLGVTRILQGCIEVLSTEKRIHWPRLIAPYQVCIIPQKEGYKADVFFQLAESLSDQLTAMSSLAGEVVIDDRTQMTVGRRLYEARRLGYPCIVVLGRKTLEDEPLYEVFGVTDEDPTFLTQDQLLNELSSVETVSLV